MQSSNENPNQRHQDKLSSMAEIQNSGVFQMNIKPGLRLNSATVLLYLRDCFIAIVMLLLQERQNSSCKKDKKFKHSRLDLTSFYVNFFQF
ncbi:hypothetical protein L1987_11623 [Smallanthus sonchifolius]|uniref:Uncharacterized protein n=1 Tax=Smallanthus sonchifolius TaxID=185202 RepID=A0ACB9JDK4_9ASTR|nr:hypothetical protein L1987_11623 [Smallanthus sonchifolius]